MAADRAAVQGLNLIVCSAVATVQLPARQIKS